MSTSTGGDVVLRSSNPHALEGFETIGLLMVFVHQLRQVRIRSRLPGLKSADRRSSIAVTVPLFGSIRALGCKLALRVKKERPRDSGYE